jgi:LacI family transcriptional regulator
MLAGTEIFKKSREPKHRQVRDFLVEQMANGRLKVGDPLPAEGTIAESLGVGRNTVRHAFAELARQGFIEKQQGRAAFVAREVQVSRETDMSVFGLILPDVRGSLYPSLIKGFGEVAAGARHSLAICETGNDVARQGDAVLQMIDRRAAGIAMVPTTDGVPSYQLRQLEERGTPIVLCHRGVDEVDAAVITWPWAEVAQRAARAIVEKGHRRVAFVAYTRHRYTQMYEDSFRAALAESGIELPEHLVCYNKQFVGPVGEDEAHRELLAMLQSPDRPTAIFANDLDVGERVYLEAIQLGLRVPGDLSIVAFGGKWREGPIREQLTAVAVDEVELGREAARQLMRIRRDRVTSVRPARTIMQLDFVSGLTLSSPSTAIIRDRRGAP